MHVTLGLGEEAAVPLVFFALQEPSNVRLVLATERLERFVLMRRARVVVAGRRRPVKLGPCALVNLPHIQLLSDLLPR